MLKVWVHVSSSHRHLKSADYATLNAYRYISSWEKLGLCLSFLSLDSCTLVALVNLSMSILRDKNSPHGCPHTGGGSLCWHTNNTAGIICWSLYTYKHSHSVPMWWEEDASPFLFSPDVLGSCCFYDPYRWIKWGVKISGFFFFFFHNSTILSQRVLSKRWKEGRGVLHMFWGPCMGISMYM